MSVAWVGVWGIPEGARQDPGLLGNIGHSACHPHVTTPLLHLAQQGCQQGAFTCSIRSAGVLPVLLLQQIYCSCTWASVGRTFLLAGRHHCHGRQG